ncbi:MAG: HAD-IC family P-type ATPase [Polyangiaceae bacterium]|nr:HAD-IC family P-type ATPase [Polyangiaceae bacterium]
MADQDLAQLDRPWHAMNVQAVGAEWQANPADGLKGADIPARRTRAGENRLSTPPKPRAILRFLAGFADPLVGALLLAGVIAAAVALNAGGDGPWFLRFSDPIAILLIVVVNGVLGFLQERRAEQALGALQRLAAPTAKVVRDGTVVVLPAAELVPGDIIELEAGDSVPADVRLFETHGFTVEEAALTGESTPTDKDGDRELPKATPLAERVTMAYVGTSVTRGRARGFVVHTGAFTELGRIDALIRSTPRDATPLEQRLARFGKQILAVCLALSAALFVLGVLRGGQAWTVLLLTAVSLAVATIPEGLPAITTITLALGMQRMAARGAIVRKLPAVETLGSATVICSDKTGTLTQNAMTVRLVETAQEILSVTGQGYLPEGAFERDHDRVETLPAAVVRLLSTGTLCNTAQLDTSGPTPAIVGDPTEAALVALALKGGIDRRSLLAEAELESELPFDADRKRMTVIVKGKDQKRVAHVKGSPDVLLPLCTHVLLADGRAELGDAERTRLLARNEVHAKQALRVLALADRDDPDAEDPEHELTFLGFAAMIDPPRPGVKAAIAECQRAGVRVVMITGDHQLTAAAIARELGFWSDDTIAMTGAELDDTDDARLLELVPRVAVFARVSAEQKVRIVRALKRGGNVAAMTGDGVNDAPALREANIGIAMGLGGTDVAREAADMVLADDNFATIVHAVREGRAIFRNITKFIFFLNSSNAGLVVAVVGGTFFADTVRFALTPLQLLWINLVTNGLPALALGMDPAEPSLMDEKPRPVREGLFSIRDLLATLAIGTLMGGSALSLYLLPDLAPQVFAAGMTRDQMLAHTRTMAFTMLGFAPLFHAFSCRSRVDSLLRGGLFTNRALLGAVAASAAVQLVTVLVPPLHAIFRTHSMSLSEWSVVIGLSVLPVPLVELGKLLWRNRPMARRAEDPPQAPPEAVSA